MDRFAESHAMNLEMLLDKLHSAHHDRHVTFDEIVHTVGQRAFGPLLLVIGLLVMSPLGGVPGMATVAGVASLIVSLQLLQGRKRFWLPSWLLRRQVPYEGYVKTLTRLQRPARWIDRFLRPRFTALVRPPALQIVALACVAAGLILPLLEAVPFADILPGATLSAFGLGLAAHDGALVLVAALLCASAAVLALRVLLG